MSRSIKVGLFVIAGLALCVVATFLIGENQQLWDHKVDFHAAFDDVAGLKPGSPVRMGGVDVGTVTAVEHSSDVNDRKIHVTVAVVRREAPRVRDDTVATIEGKGLLGDKMLVLSTEGKGPSLAPGGELRTSVPVDITEAIGAVAQKANDALKNVDEVTTVLNDPRFKDNLRASLEDVRLILDGVARQDSAAHRLFMDPTEGARLDEAISRLNAASAELDATLANARAATEQLKTGPGLAHALLYDGDLSKNASGALEEVHKDLEAIRTGNGLAHSLLYGDEGSQQHVMQNVDAMSDDLRAIIHDVRQGKGTLGALIVDPSVYDDLRALVGNVERNEVLRALVRYSIKADEDEARSPRVTSDTVKKSIRSRRHLPGDDSPGSAAASGARGPFAGDGFGHATVVEPERFTPRRRKSNSRSAKPPNAPGRSPVKSQNVAPRSI